MVRCIIFSTSNEKSCRAAEYNGHETNCREFEPHATATRGDPYGCGSALPGPDGGRHVQASGMTRRLLAAGRGRPPDREFPITEPAQRAPPPAKTANAA